ncbi:amino acid ABC transporter permease [Pontibacillus marinus]|uniref:Polar amino acid ABC transporter permease n=1 Tax=Pontibacillus marinus BH030004 = DSM 16465 TaxID=1385511 RepID=A0A0A5GE33_9BACI|nr:ABC transporter permease subunit [Pontibacillus marinus]KGX89458.1 polar amino acid ABC transporter permease [Pontibacillus marinus BH030004 = DSM 16465]
MKKDIADVPTPFWRNKKVIPFLAQGIFAVIIAISLLFLFSNALDGLRQMGISLGFDFLKSSASFGISESLIDYTPESSYGTAFLVGVLNTLRVSFFGIIIASLIGLVVGISRLSNNWLVNKTASIYVEIFRNTPLLVQISIWYFAVFLPLPRIEESTRFLFSYFSNRGSAIPWFQATSGTLVWVLLFAVGVIASVIVWKLRLKKQIETGENKRPGVWAIGVVILSLVIAFLATFQAPFNITLPTVEGRSFMGGLRLSPEFLAILLGLVIYTSTYIGEIVRGGIQSVQKGQVEAAKALGLKPSTTMRLVIFPQAIRVIIPPVTSQYLNLIKNSSLAIAVGYQEVVSVGETINNQTGKAIESVTIMILVYLTFSLLTSFFMNQFNKRSQIVER